MLAESLLVRSVLLSLITVTDGQTTQTANNSQLICYYCTHSNDNEAVEWDQDQNPECLTKAKFSVLPEMQRICATNENSCTSIVVNENGLFLTVQRDCATDCDPGCMENGYGIFFTTCTRCCTDSLCNDADGAAYYKPKSAHHSMLSLSIVIIETTSLLAFYASTLI